MPEKEFDKNKLFDRFNDMLDDDPYGISSFSYFFSSIKGTKFEAELMDTKYSLIEAKFNSILNELSEMGDDDYKLKFTEDVSIGMTILICKDEYGDKLSLCSIREKQLKLRELFHKKAKDSDIFLNLDYTDKVIKALDEWYSLKIFNVAETTEKKIKSMLNKNQKVTGIFLQKRSSLFYELVLKIGHLDILDPNLWKTNYFILEEMVNMEQTGLKWCDENEDIIEVRTSFARPFELKELYKELYVG